jgi:hypothetical protein
MAKAPKPHTAISPTDKELLKVLYEQHATVQVDNLSNTEDLKRIQLEFNAKTGRSLTEEDTRKALKNIGRRGGLGGKFHK